MPEIAPGPNMVERDHTLYVTSDNIDRRVSNTERVIGARIDGMEKAVAVFQSDLTRVPTQLDRAISSLREVLEEKISGDSLVVRQRLDGMDKAIELFQKFTDLQPQFVREQVMHLRELHDAEFKGTQSQLTLIKEAAKQLDNVNQTALTSALTAQKENAAETQKSSQAAIAKSETSTSEAIKALTTTFNAAIAGATMRIDDLKSRLDRGEGKTSVSDPETTLTLRLLTDKINNLTDLRNQHVGGEKVMGDNSTRIVAFIAIAVSIAVGVGQILVHLH